MSIPTNPTTQQLRRHLGAIPRRLPPLALPARAASAQPRPVRHIRSYLCFSEIFGTRLPARDLLDRVSGLDIAETFGRVATIAAIVAYQGPQSPDAQRLTTGPLIALSAQLNPYGAQVGDFVASAGADRPLAHEKVFYFIEALVLLAGAKKGKIPSDQDLAFLMLASNDYLDGWELADDAKLTHLERVLAEVTHASRFNRSGDPLSDLVRGALLMGTIPPQGPFSDPEMFARLQESAFGMPFVDYVEQLAGPLFMQATQWGRRDVTGELRLPVLHPTTWVSQTRIDPAVSRSFFERMTLCHYGCAIRAHLVVTGRLAGQVLLDRRTEANGVCVERFTVGRCGHWHARGRPPVSEMTPLGFIEWYADWLVASLDATTSRRVGPPLA